MGRCNRTELTPDIKDKLIDCWKHGMRTADSPIVHEAAATTGLSHKKIKTWINNYRRGFKNGRNSTTATKLLRGTNGYNLYCSSLDHIDFSQFGVMWSKLSPEEKNDWNERAKFTKKDTGSQVRRRKKNNFTALKRITEDFQQMGIPFGGLIIFEGCAEVFGDDLSKAYLLGNPKFLSNFAQHHSQQEEKTVHSDNVLSLRSEVRTIFNSKYSEAVGSTLKMPYGKKNTFQVLGLPFKFKNPSNYGQNQCKQIIDCQHDIMVIINNQQNISQTASVETTVEVIDMVEVDDQQHSSSIGHIDRSETDDQEKWERALRVLIDE